MAQDKLSYRADIDGLRAIAIVSVVVFHYGLWLEDSGFAGVDLFFAISGYLITSLIKQDITAGTFSLVDFYARRIRRIVPALLVMTLVVLAVGLIMLGPSDLEALGASGLAAIFGYANFHFYFATGYFDTAAFTKPLLHTWSLGVEEQFYLIWAPLLFAAAYLTGKAFGNVMVALLIAIIVASFTMALFLSKEDPDLGFYMPHARAWELGLGALAALVPLPKVGKTLMQLLSVVALASLIGGFAALEYFGGNNIWGVFAVVGGGAAVLWLSGQGTFVSRVLSLPPFPAIGLVSYSLYLWHWPVLVFLFIWNNELDLTGTQALSALAVAASISVLSYYLVEKPARRPAIQRSTVYVAGVGGMAAVGLMAFALIALNGLPSRFNSEAQAILTSGTREAPKFSRRACTVTTSSASWERDCVVGDAPDGAIAVIGDSFAGAYQQAINDRFPDTNLFRAACSGSSPLYVTKEPRSGCERLWAWFYGDLIVKKRVETVVIVARWHSKSYPSLAETVSYLTSQGIRVVVVGQQPEFDVSPKQIVEAAFLPRARYETPGLLRQADKKRQENARMREETEREGGEFFDPLEVLCEGDVCRTATPDGIAMAYDYGHLTAAGADYLVGEFAKLGLKLP